MQKTIDWLVAVCGSLHISRCITTICVHSNQAQFQSCNSCKSHLMHASVMSVVVSVQETEHILMDWENYPYTQFIKENWFFSSGLDLQLSVSPLLPLTLGREIYPCWFNWHIECYRIVSDFFLSYWKAHCIRCFVAMADFCCCCCNSYFRCYCILPQKKTHTFAKELVKSTTTSWHHHHLRARNCGHS